jgi:hypothetical protein
MKMPLIQVKWIYNAPKNWIEKSAVLRIKSKQKPILLGRLHYSLQNLLYPA